MYIVLVYFAKCNAFLTCFIVVFYTLKFEALNCKQKLLGKLKCIYM